MELDRTANTSWPSVANGGIKIKSELMSLFVNVFCVFYYNFYLFYSGAIWTSTETRKRQNPEKDSGAECAGACSTSRFCTGERSGCNTENHRGSHLYLPIHVRQADTSEGESLETARVHQLSCKHGEIIRFTAQVTHM